MHACLEGKVLVVLAALNCLQDVLGAMSPPPAPMFMPHGASLDTSSDELQSPLAVLGAREDVAAPGAHRCARFVSVTCGLLCASDAVFSEAASAEVKRETRTSTFTWICDGAWKCLLTQRAMRTIAAGSSPVFPSGFRVA